MGCMKLIMNLKMNPYMLKKQPEKRILLTIGEMLKFYLNICNKMNISHIYYK